MLKQWRFWLGLALSALFVALALRGQDLGQVRAALAEADYRAVLPALLLYFAGVWVRALRWRHLLLPVRQISARTLFPVVVIGYMANNVLPWRIGELVRGYVLREREGVPTGTALATIAVERIFDGLTMLLFLIGASLFIPLDAEVRRLASVAALVFVVLLIGLFVVVLSDGLRRWLLGLVARILPAALADRLTRLVESFVSGLHTLRSAFDLGVVGGYSLLAWGLESAMYLTVARGFPFSLDPAGALMACGVANLATLIPSTPGYIGVFEYGIGLVVNRLLGVASEVALSYAIVLHAALYFPITLWGLYYWSRANLSFGAIRAGGTTVSSE